MCLYSLIKDNVLPSQAFRDLVIIMLYSLVEFLTHLVAELPH